MWRVQERQAAWQYQLKRGSWNAVRRREQWTEKQRRERHVGGAYRESWQQRWFDFTGRKPKDEAMRVNYRKKPGNGAQRHAKLGKRPRVTNTGSSAVDESKHKTKTNKSGYKENVTG